MAHIVHAHAYLEMSPPKTAGSQVSSWQQGLGVPIEVSKYTSSHHSNRA